IAKSVTQETSLYVKGIVKEDERSDRSGALSQLLQAVADSGSNVLSIHQTIPLQGRANVTLSISTSAMEENIHTLMNKLRKFDFIEKVEILGSGA
ncbi:ACT domain-containing protein, partial [Bacillus velezensis]